MKNLIAIVLALLISFTLSANEKSVDSKIEKVTVYQQGAQIFREAKTSLTKGRNEIVFTKLAMQIDANSIQVSGKGDFTILSVIHRLNYLEQQEKKKELKMLQDSLKYLQKEVDYKNQIQALYNQQYNVLETNKALRGNENGVDVAALKEFYTYYQKEMKILKDKQFKIKYQIQELNQDITRIRNQINANSRMQNKAVSEIVVTVEAEKNTYAKLEANYIVWQASWSPIYDLRSEKIEEPVSLHYRANIYQNTGIDWENVDLSISTGNPSRNGTIPKIAPWYLQYYLQNYNNNSLSYSQNKTKRLNKSPRAELQSVEIVQEADAVSLDDVRITGNAGNSSNFTSVSQNQTNATFEISIPYTIPSSNKKVSVKIQKSELPATYRYYCAPKLDKDAFLEARITGWDELNLLAGEVNVFFEGTYIGKSYLNPRNLTDTMEVSMGRDKSIVVERKKLKDKSKSSLIGKNKKAVTEYEISIRNSKATSIDILIQDHIPISRLDKIEVSLDRKDGAKYNDKTGILSWEYTIEAKESKEFGFAYTIKYPKEYRIVNQ